MIIEDVRFCPSCHRVAFWIIRKHPVPDCDCEWLDYEALAHYCRQPDGIEILSAPNWGTVIMCNEQSKGFYLGCPWGDCMGTAKLL